MSTYKSRFWKLFSPLTHNKIRRREEKKVIVIQHRNTSSSNDSFLLLFVDVGRMEPKQSNNLMMRISNSSSYLTVFKYGWHRPVFGIGPQFRAVRRAFLLPCHCLLTRTMDVMNECGRKIVKERHRPLSLSGLFFFRGKCKPQESCNNSEKSCMNGNCENIVWIIRATNPSQPNEL